MRQWNNRKSYTPKQAMEKAARYCAQRERSQKEVLEKLQRYGLNHQEAEEVLVDLISLDFVNEQRFAEAFVRGKFKQLKWGKKKIRQGLQEHNIPLAMQNRALASEIDQMDYSATLRGLLERKYTQVKERQRHFLKRKKALVDYGLQKGYEQGLVYALAEAVMKEAGKSRE